MQTQLRGRGEMEGSRAATAPGGEVDVSRELEMRLGISLDGAKAADSV